ncbi:unnamed protein product [Rotaria sordida]|uniref:Uncharacterized protein n=1 Tax=Rotaria sordida TaxID=392033 RepID=A0A819EZ70_9BILA|nr:unnamed protein product [Rotaria sordida]
MFIPRKLTILRGYGFHTALINYDLIVRSIPSNPDGYPRSVIIIHHANSSWNIDRPFPGPLIRARLGDQLRIRVQNKLRDQATAIHFHGLHMLANPWADGTEYITQCPILPHSSFIHEFNVTQTGTFWYHSHNAQQYADGLYGPIIIDGDSISQHYEYGSNDQTIMLQEWYHETWPDIMTAYQGPHGAYPGSVAIYPWPPTTFLINGHGRFDCRTNDCSRNDTWKDRCGNVFPVQCIPLRDPFFGPCIPDAHPIDEFQCLPGKQMRLRLINAASGIPFRFWIDQHNLTIVARDGSEIEPITVSYLHIPIGQRLDLIINCNQDPTSAYEIIVASRNSFQPPEIIIGQMPTMWTTARLVYPQSKANMRTTNVNEEMKINAEDPFFEYKYLKPLLPRRAKAAIRRVTLTFVVHWNNRTGIDALEEWAVNNITFEPPKEPLLQGIFLDGTDKHILATEYPGRVNNTHATYIEHFEYGQTYEVVMINNDPQEHPWHLHGYTMDFIAAGRLPNRELPPCNQPIPRSMDINLDSLLPPLNSTPPVLAVGDSFNAPRDSYVVFRFKADNAGPWYLHCHMDWHISPGMALAFSVGHKGSYRDLIQPPPKDFPTCGPRQILVYKSASSHIAPCTLFNSSMILILMVFVHFITLSIDILGDGGGGSQV